MAHGLDVLLSPSQHCNKAEAKSEHLYRPGKSLAVVVVFGSPPDSPAGTNIDAFMPALSHKMVSFQYEYEMP